MVEETKFDKLQAQVDDGQRLIWENIQNDLKQKLIETDDFEWTISKNEANTLQRVAAVDISYSKTP
jgi:hypothetical protein